MKLKTTLLAALLAAFAGTTMTAYAAEDKAAADKATEVKAPEAKPAQEKPKKKLKRHSHMEEKTGMSSAVPEDKVAAKKPLHDHQKEHK